MGTCTLDPVGVPWGGGWFAEVEFMVRGSACHLGGILWGQEGILQGSEEDEKPPRGDSKRPGVESEPRSSPGRVGMRMIL